MVLRCNGEMVKGYGFVISYTKLDDWFSRFDYALRIGIDDMMSREAQSHSSMWFLQGKIF